LTSDEIFEYLTSTSNIIWRENTRHEAMLLACSFIEICSQKQYEKLINYFLQGPPDIGLDDQDLSDADASVFELLHYVHEKCEKQLTSTANKIHQSLQKKGYQANIENPGIRTYLLASKSELHVPEFPDLLSMNATQVVTRILEQEDNIRFERRAIYEQCGALMVVHRDWGVSVLEVIGQRIGEFEGNQIGPVFWGMHAGLEDQELNEANTKHIISLIESLRQIIHAHPSVELWSSLPSVLEKVVEKFHLECSVWNEIAALLTRIYINFDYSRSEGEDDIRWLDRAINHPLGRITTIFLNEVQRSVNTQVKENSKYSLPVECRNHFETVLLDYEDGSRYSLCIMAQRFRWFEAIDIDWAHKYLEPYFHWGLKIDEAVVTWSGFLWANSLSTYLSDNYESMYLPCVNRLNEFGGSAQKGLAKHISAIFWFGYADMKLLKATIDIADKNFICRIIREWPSHFSNASDEVLENFFIKIIEPVWEWMNIKGVLRTDRGVDINNSLWHLLPYSKNRFHEVALLALKIPFTTTRDDHRILDGMLKSGLADSFPLEFAQIMHQVLVVAENPQWKKDKWIEIWQLIAGKDFDEVSMFRDELERQQIILPL